MGSEGYDTAQVCLNGHVTNDSCGYLPDRNQEHCSKCGAETIVTCPHCKTSIRGHLHGSFPSPSHEPPAFCCKCGKPYPWTETRLESAKDLAGQLDLDIPERTLLEKSIEEMVRDTPRAPAEAVRFKGLVGTKPLALAAFKEILGAVVSETVKKMIWPDP